MTVRHSYIDVDVLEKNESSSGGALFLFIFWSFMSQKPRNDDIRVVHLPLLLSSRDSVSSSRICCSPMSRAHDVSHELATAYTLCTCSTFPKFASASPCVVANLNYTERLPQLHASLAYESLLEWFIPDHRMFLRPQPPSFV